MQEIGRDPKKGCPISSIKHILLESDLCLFSGKYVCIEAWRAVGLHKLFIFRWETSLARTKYFSPLSIYIYIYTVYAFHQIKKNKKKKLY